MNGDSNRMDATLWDERYGAAELVWGAEPNQFVREMCERLPIGDALDLACGEGRNALWLARLGWRTLGVDFSAVAVERARALTAREDEALSARASWAVADITAPNYSPAPADLVLVSYVHLPPSDSERLIRLAARAVRPDGHLVVVGHDVRNLDEGVGGPADVTVLYQPDVIAAFCREEGLDVENASTVQRVIATGTALDTLVRARRPTQPGEQ